MTIEKLLDQQIKDFEHNYNPLHLYVRLRRLGIEKRKAINLIRSYDYVYKDIIAEYKSLQNENS